MSAPERNGYRRSFKPTLRVLAAILSVLAGMALAGCNGGASKSSDRAAPVTLAYPYGEGGTYLFAGYDRITAEAARSFVTITILADRATVDQTGSELVSSASGTIVDAGGLIVTAAHIATNSKYRARVTTIDGTVMEGRVIALDRDRELAVIKVPPNPGLTAATFADSSTLARRDHAVAIGAPRRHTGAVSLGIVREPQLDYPLEYNGYTLPNAIVISMEVEPGHSGGPVFDKNGALIGMIASFALGDTRKVPYQSPRIAFAVPSNDIAAYVESVAGGQ
ncbi:MAG: trypsin-like peptidase domain-containing protein [Alphaproteobacteria bacterium]|nr:trypsin-like peptidase domain-containing protein [Alphaproteobacteria bacterium]